MWTRPLGYWHPRGCPVQHGPTGHGALHPPWGWGQPRAVAPQDQPPMARDTPLIIWDYKTSLLKPRWNTHSHYYAPIIASLCFIRRYRSILRLYIFCYNNPKSLLPTCIWNCQACCFPLLYITSPPCFLAVFFFPFRAVFADLQTQELTHFPDICELLMRVFQKVP